jgi:hypothetical protein
MTSVPEEVKNDMTNFTKEDSRDNRDLFFNSFLSLVDNQEIKSSLFNKNTQLEGDNQVLNKPIAKSENGRKIRFILSDSNLKANIKYPLVNVVQVILIRC